MLLTEPVDAADPLLHLHGIPGKIVVYNYASELHVQAFARRIRTDQQPYLSVLQPPFNFFLAAVVPVSACVTPCAAGTGIRRNSLDRKLAESSYDKERLPRFNRIPKSKWEIPLLALRYARKKSVVLETEGLAPQRFHGRIAILVNEHTNCAAEMVALFGQERGLVNVVGMPTPGRLVSHRGFDIGHGFTLVIPTGAYVSWMGTPGRNRHGSRPQCRLVL